MKTTNQRLTTFGRSSMALTVSFFLLLSGVSLAQSQNQETFPSAEKATRALFTAVQSDDENAIARVLGGTEDLVSCGDDLTDHQDREVFLEKYRQMHRLVQEPDGTTELYIGAENWPFPVPLVSKNDKWFFDGDAGKQEVVFRRIGENQHDSLETSVALSAGAEPPPDVQHGYYFRKLNAKASGGANDVIFIAYPAEYRSSGVMTFAVTANHVVFEKDLGPQTATIAKTANTLKLDHSWHQAEKE